MPKLDISFHEEEDILVIQGVHYTGDLFRTFSLPESNALYQFERTRELPELVTITKITEGDRAKEILDNAQKA